MGSQNLEELCTSLVRNSLGELNAQIFATLAEHGRLTIPSLAELSKIPARRLRTALASLLEEQLLLHFAGEEGTSTYYSVDWHNAYNLVRQTNIVHLVKERHGSGAGQIVSNILQLGHARVGDLAEVYGLTPDSTRDSGADSTADRMTETGIPNGAAKSTQQKPSFNQHVTSVSEFHSVMRALLMSGILVKVGNRSYIPPPDLQDQIEETVISEQFPDRKINGPKKQSEFKLAVNALKRKWRDEDAYSDMRDVSSKGTVKRPGDHFNSNGNKRARLNGDVLSGGREDVTKLSDDLIVCVDLARCTLALRSQRLERLALRFLGNVTASVYCALLRSLEGKVETAQDGISNDDLDNGETGLPVSTLNEIAEALDPSIELASSIKGLSSGKPAVNGLGKKDKSNHVIDEDDFSELGIKREYQSDSEDEPPTNGFSSYLDRDKRVKHIEAHLLLLEEHSKQFCQRARSHGGSNEWRVNFPALTYQMTETEVDSVIGARYGRVSLRITRMLRERGRLDEKQVAAFAMMRIKDVRAVLTELQFHGIVEAQELPKDNYRQPSRTLYLWFFDQKRVQNTIIQHTYKAMSRTIQRVSVERDNYRSVIEKAERTDVKDNEQEKLDQTEKVVLREWRETEERLLTQVTRMDEVIALLRDFSGKDMSLVT